MSSDEIKKDNAPFAEPSIAPTMQRGRGRPKKYDMGTRKTTVTFSLEQIVALDRLGTSILATTGRVVDRGDIVRAAIDALLESGVDFLLDRLDAKAPTAIPVPDKPAALDTWMRCAAFAKTFDFVSESGLRTFSAYNPEFRKECSKRVKDALHFHPRKVIEYICAARERNNGSHGKLYARLKSKNFYGALS